MAASFRLASTFCVVCPGPGSPGALGFSSGKAGALGSGKDILCVKPPKPPSLAAHKVKLNPMWGRGQQWPWQRGGSLLLLMAAW